MDFVLNFIDKKVTKDMNRSLGSPVTKAEIHDAAFSLGKAKALRLDGFSGLFYQASWAEVGDTVWLMVHDFFAGNTQLDDLNVTNLTLIPKVERPDHVSQFHPIGLCNFSYKIISKIIANRMKPLLDCCVSQSQ